MKAPGKIHITALLFLAAFYSLAQNPVNAYANVTAISGTSLSVNNVNETFHTFENGEYVIIMQMQDNVIGTNTTNVNTFGDLGSIQSAGLFEIAQISTHTEAASLPNSITLTSGLVNTYNINTNASVQLITFRLLGANYTTSANIGTLAWNGNVGGVTAISVPGVLTMGHSITASGCGFSGGVRNTPNGYSACDDATYITALAQRYAGKGEGIYKRTNASFSGARGKILNGGGGGNDVNAGGGGGGNYTAGGGGGSGWTPSGSGCSPIVGGLGGLSLGGLISGSRVFMGGGGGGGHENDNNGTVGGAGGGIILIKTGTLVTASCVGVSITSNGVTPANASNDGAGGAGAGGSIVFNVATYSVAGSCPLTISSNGGNGGNSNAGGAGAHGGGGGGGQGVIIYSLAQPTTNMTSSTIAGTGGVSCAGCPGSTNGSVGSGTTNVGVITGGAGPLPVDLVKFEGYINDSNQVVLQWQTGVEKNSVSFIVERMRSEAELENLAEIKTKGNNSTYSYTDLTPTEGINYYRLKELALDGTISFKNWIEVNVSTVTKHELIFYPNPLDRAEILSIVYRGANSEKMQIEFLDMTGKIFQSVDLKAEEGIFKLNVEEFAPGVYTARVKINSMIYYRKVLIKD